MPTVTSEASETSETSPGGRGTANADTASPIVPLGAASERFGYIDALRGFAVVLMVQQHLGVWLTALHRLRGGLLPLVMGLNSLGGAAAPLFVFLAGVSLTLGKHLAPSVLLRRGLALAACGYVLNLACPSWFSAGSFYVLHLIACLWLVGPLLRRCEDGWLLALFVGVLLLTVAVQTWLRTPPYLANARLADTSLAGGALRLALAEGHFPLLPWLAFGMLGVWAGRRVQSGRVGSLYALAGMLLATYAALRLPRLLLEQRELRRLPWRNVVDFSFYPATVAFVLGLSGACVILLVLARRTSESPAGVRGWLEPLGRTSLTLLVLHVVVFREGSVALGLYQRVPPGIVLALLLIVLTGWTLLARAWARANYRYSLEWWIRAAGGRPRAQDLPR